MERKSRAQWSSLPKALILAALIAVGFGSGVSLPTGSLASSGTSSPSQDFSPGCTFIGLAFPSGAGHPTPPCVPSGTSTMTVTPSPGLLSYPEQFTVAINTNVSTTLPANGYVNPNDPNPWDGTTPVGASINLPAISPRKINWSWSTAVVDFETTGTAPWLAHTAAEYSALTSCPATYPTIGTVSYGGVTTHCTTLQQTAFTHGAQDTFNFPYSYSVNNANYTPFIFVNWTTPMPYSAQYPCATGGYPGPACPRTYDDTGATTYTPYTSFTWNPDVVTNTTIPYTSHTASWSAVGYSWPGAGADLGTKYSLSAHDVMQDWATGMYDSMCATTWSASLGKTVGCGYPNEAAACPTGNTNSGCQWWYYYPTCAGGSPPDGTSVMFGNGSAWSVGGGSTQCWIQGGGGSNGTYYPQQTGCPAGWDNSQTSSSACQYSTDTQANLTYNQSTVSRGAAPLVTEYDLHAGTAGVYGTTPQSYAMKPGQTAGYDPYCPNASDLSTGADWTSGIAGVGTLIPGCVPNNSTTALTIVVSYNNQYWGTTPSTTPPSYDNNATAEDNQTLNNCSNGSGLLHCVDIHTVNTRDTGNYLPQGAKVNQYYFSCGGTNNYSDDPYDDSSSNPIDPERPAGAQSETGITDGGSGSQASQPPISNYYGLSGWNGSCSQGSSSYYDFGPAYDTDTFLSASDSWRDANTVNDNNYTADCMSDSSPTTVGTPGPGGQSCPTAASKNYDTPAWQSFPQLCSGVGAGNPEAISDPALMNAVRAANPTYKPDNNPSAAPYSPLPMENGTVSAPSPVTVTAPACQSATPPILNVSSPEGQSLSLSITQEQPVQGMLLHSSSGSVMAAADLAPRRRPA